MDVSGDFEIWLRVGIFAGLLALFFALEALWPRRYAVLGRTERWRTNLSMGLINMVAVRLLGPLTAIAAASYTASHNLGLLNQWDGPSWIKFIIALLILDLFIYLQHVLTHKIPILWRLHKVHHSDRDIDASTALRFHPGEIVLSMLYKCAIVLALGPTAFAVLIFEIVLNGSAMFNHSNLKLPKKIDKLLRFLIVTPDMHRVHHSVIQTETDSNYGFNLSLWDFIFNTYRAQPAKGHQNMTIGLSEYQSQKPASLFWSLKLPIGSKTDIVEK
ncbi:MAG: sterol desaturase family protein [Hellea sp.]|nr:sterol desaturase family protein [Hellea sp.]